MNIPDEVFQQQVRVPASATPTGAPARRHGLSLSRYKPDLRQVRVRKRIKSALDAFLPYYTGRERQLSQKILEKYFGPHQNPMYRWLRANLLRDVRSFSVPAKRATTYIVHQEGFDNLWASVHRTAFNYAPERANQVRPLFEPYISGDQRLPLHQTKEGGRIYGPHQWLERDVRAILLPGCYDYDIQAAMPTLVLQSTGEDWENKYPFWNQYLGARKHFRDQLADDYGLTVAQAKEVFQLLFSGAMFNGSRHGVGKVLNTNQLKKALKDPWLVGLKNEAHTCWCRKELPIKRGPERFAFYEQIEQQIMAVVYSYLYKRSERFWPFHDGFTMITGRASCRDLSRLVNTETGYSVIFDEKQL